MAGSFAELAIRFTADLKSFSTGIQNATRQMDREGKKMQKIGKSMSVAITAPLVGLGAVALKSAADLETLQTSLESSFQGNQQAAKAAFDQITKFSSETPFQVEQVAEAFIKLKNLGLDPSERALRSYGNTASAMGKSLDQFIEAVADAATNEFERLKEFGIKAKQQGDQVAFTFQGVTTTVEKNAEDIQQYLLNIGETNFAGAIEKQAQTFNGRLSTMRDNLNLLAAEFGQIIIEAVSPFIDKIGEIARDFKALDPETKKIIVAVAAFAAALGPVVIITGTLIRNVSTLIPLMNKLRLAIAANPYTALAVAIGAVAAALGSYYLSANESLQITKLLNSVRKSAASIVAQERAKIDSLVKIAQNENLEKQDRISAINKLNTISPDYLGNLKLETINTKEASDALAVYIEQINKKALAQAAMAKKQELFAELIEVQNEPLRAQVGFLQDTSDAFFKLFGVETQYYNGVDDFNKKLQERIDKNEITEKQADNLRAAYKDIIDDRNADVKSIQDQISALDKYVDVTNQAVASTQALGDTVVPTGEGGRRNVTTVNTIETEGVQQLDSPLDDLVARIPEQAELIKIGLDDVGNKFQEVYDRTFAIGTAIADVFNGFAASLVDSLGLANDGFQGFVKSILSTGLQLVQQLVAEVVKTIALRKAQSVANAAAGATASAAASGPAAIFTQPAFLATAIGGVLSAFAAIPKFANGGIVPGNLTTGDRTLARVNAGELILNAAQQNNLASLLTGGSEGGPQTLTTRVSGEDLVIILNRAQQSNKRR